MRTIVRGLGELALTAGLVLALGVAYLVWGTGDYTRGQQDGLLDQMERRWRADRSAAATATAGSGPARRGARRGGAARTARGTAFAIIRVPRFGRSYRYVVVEGVSPADLRKGPGHYPGTARPGDIGNMVVSGHRTTYGAPFNRLGELAPGDEIRIEATAGTYVYRVTGLEIVRPGSIEVTAPVRGRPGRAPRRRLLTLTTCHPKFSAAYRLVVAAEMARFEPGTAGT
ncbi:MULTISPECIES: class E sortase [Actinomadura]|uniref:Class E sortase n=1 Tax=Actinomadura yumaensis TaxID=111807 RepID=A0ABW2CCP4_9ACTN|nr:class E sortase [Actinomadura sp. J1-007]MWK38344.1 class E sortase [Actinomadura sp. J1-007]